MAKPLTDAIEALTTYANSVTGASDTTLSEAVATLAEGYGGGSIDEIATDKWPSGAITLSNTVTQIEQHAFAGKPITSIKGEGVTAILSDAFANTQITSITDEDFPLLGVNSRWIVVLNCKSLVNIKLSGERIALSSGSSALRSHTNLVRAEFPNAAKNVGASYVGVGNYAFAGCSNLELLDIGYANGFGSNQLQNDYKLQTIITRKTSVIPLSNVNAFTNTPFRGYNNLTGTIYCPRDLITQYQQATNWSTLYDAGTCTFEAIEGSEYE